jgi:hypothetical protein
MWGVNSHCPRSFFFRPFEWNRFFAVLHHSGAAALFMLHFSLHCIMQEPLHCSCCIFHAAFFAALHHAGAAALFVLQFSCCIFRCIAPCRSRCNRAPVPDQE